MEDIKRTVCGFGIVDVDYKVTEKVDFVQPSGEVITKRSATCPYYVRWKSMISRCYSQKYLLCRPTYKFATVCEDWERLSNFKAWMLEQTWEGRYLDKDYLGGNSKIYSPETCLFITYELNNFPITCEKLRAGLPLGVTYDKHRDKYMAKVTDGNNKTKFLGRYKTPEEAHGAWQIGKAKVGESLEEKYRHWDSRLLDSLSNMVDKLYCDNLQGVQTFSLHP